MAPQTRKEFLLTMAGAASLPAAQAEETKVLLIVAHPDDEYAMAATVYKITHELGGVVDQMIVTNGESGFRYSQIAEAFYGVRLTEESTGRSRLPEIRKEEALQSGRVLGIRKHVFLDQKDSQFSTDGTEPFGGLWDRELVGRSIRSLLQRENYQFVFVLLPTEDTHGHHQAAAQIAMEEVMAAPEAKRPVVIGAEAANDGDVSQRFTSRGRIRALASKPNFLVSRLETFGPGGQLNYNIVVNWVIAAHKSQGLFQTECGKHTVEQFWVFDNGRANSQSEAAKLFARLQPATRSRAA